MTNEPKRTNQSLLRPRLLLSVIKAAGLAPSAIVFGILFLIATLIVTITEPGIDGFANSAWLMFQVVTTIGLGAYTCTTLTGRIVTIILSIYSVFFLALITGAVVSYCSERMNIRRNGTLAHFIDQLEHLPELSPEELADLSERVKKFDYRKLKSN